MEKDYQVVESSSKLDSRELAEFLSKDGQLLLPLLDLVTQGERAIDDVLPLTLGRDADLFADLCDRLHFGLAKTAKVDLVEIRWPSGKTELIKDLAADKFYAIKEGSGVVERDNIRPKKRSS